METSDLLLIGGAVLLVGYLGGTQKSLTGSVDQFLNAGTRALNQSMSTGSFNTSDLAISTARLFGNIGAWAINPGLGIATLNLN